jgi:predicted porin
VAYSFEKRNSELEFALSLAQLDYQLLTGDASQSILVDGEDQNQGALNVTYSQNFTNRLSAVFAAAYELQEHQNRDDNTDAYQLTAEFAYTLTRSFDLEFSLAYDAAKGLNTRGTAEDPELIMIDQTEASATIGVRWAPITRASREMTLEISSLLE